MREILDKDGREAFIDGKQDEVDLSNLLSKVGVPGHFQQFRWNPEVGHRVNKTTWRYVTRRSVGSGSWWQVEPSS